RFLGTLVPVIGGQFIGDDVDIALSRLGIAPGDEPLLVLLPLKAILGRDHDRVLGVLGLERQALRQRMRRAIEHEHHPEPSDQQPLHGLPSAAAAGAGGESAAPDCGWAMRWAFSTAFTGPVKMTFLPLSVMLNPTPSTVPNDPWAVTG